MAVVIVVTTVGRFYIHIYIYIYNRILHIKALYKHFVEETLNHTTAFSKSTGMKWLWAKKKWFSGKWRRILINLFRFTLANHIRFLLIRMQEGYQVYEHLKSCWWRNLVCTREIDNPHGNYAFSINCNSYAILHKKRSFSLRISSVNTTKSAVSCGFVHIYWRNP